MNLKQIIPLITSKGASAKLTILIYHRVLQNKDPYRNEEITAADFDWQMALIAKNFRVMKLADAAQGLKAGSLPAGALCITFDDGYADNHQVALPILKKWDLPATFFISTSYLDGGCMWNDVVIDSIAKTEVNQLDLSKQGLGSYPLSGLEERRSAIADIIKRIKHMPYDQRLEITSAVRDGLSVKMSSKIMMTTAQVKELHENGMEIGAHTHTHPILAKINDATALNEIEKSKQILESMLQSRVNLFAYPNGRPESDYKGQHVLQVKELGFDAAVSTAWGVATQNSDLFQLPRFTPWDRTPAKFMIRLLKNYYH